jgi:hypothetical protein
LSPAALPSTIIRSSSSRCSRSSFRPKRLISVVVLPLPGGHPK